MDTAIAYEKVRRIIDEMNLDAILITDRYNMRYIASYRSEEHTSELQSPS